MTDMLDIKAKKMQMAWDMAMTAANIDKDILHNPGQSAKGYLSDFAGLLREAYGIVDKVFKC